MLRAFLPVAAISSLIIYPSTAIAHHNSLLRSLRATAAEITVRIDAEAPGSGTLIAQDGNTYTVLTAQHLVAFEDNYRVVTADGLSHSVESITLLDNIDLALVTFASNRPYPIARLSTFPTASRQSIFLSGWPTPYQETSGYAFLPGELVSPPHAAPYAADPVAKGYDLFYTNFSAAGLSGGPLLDSSGRLVGIHGRTDGTRILDTATQQSRRVQIGYSSGISIRTFLNHAPNNLRNRLTVETAPYDAPSQQDLWEISFEINSQLDGFSAFPDAIDWLNHSNRLFRSHRLIEALQAADQSTQIEPELMEAWYFRSVILYELGNFSSALTSADLVVALAPDFGLGWRQRGLTLAALG
ncbi:MAG: tetratricopeptide repeat-containing serine protease family protein, partial [Cyanobacteria bacterium J06632_3]